MDQKKKWMVYGAILAIVVLGALGAVVVRQKLTLKDLEEAQEPLKEEFKKNLTHFMSDLKNAEMDFKPLENLTKFLFYLLAPGQPKLEFEIDMRVKNTQDCDIDITDLDLDILVENTVIDSFPFSNVFLKPGQDRIFTIKLSEEKFLKMAKGGLTLGRKLAKHCDEKFGGEVKVTMRFRATGHFRKVFAVRDTAAEIVHYGMMPGKDGLQYSFSWGRPEERVKKGNERWKLNDVWDPLFWTASTESTAKLSCTVKNLTRGQTVKKEIEPQIWQAIAGFFEKLHWTLDAKLIDLAPGERITFTWPLKIEKRIADWLNPYLYPGLKGVDNSTWNDVLLWVRKGEKVQKLVEVEVGSLETKFGKMVIEFYPNLAPKTVKRIKELIGKGFYDGLIFHRVAPGFCIQGGDPTGTGRGGTGVNIPGEFSKEPFVEGSVGMARSNDPDSNDCQFFITLSRKSHLDGEYTLFGKVIEGMDVAHKIEKVPLKGGSVPKDDVHILSFRLEKRKLEK
jgi:peptidylprolyl isomerase